MRLKELREARNFSRAYVAEQIGVNTETIGRYERGEREPLFSDGLSLAKILGVTPEQLVSSFDTDEDHRIERARIVRWLSKWAAEINEQVDDGHEPMDIVLDFEDPSRWNKETIRLKRYLKDGVPNLQRLCHLMAEVPDEDGELEKTA